MITKLYSALKKRSLVLVLTYALLLTVTSFMNLKDVPSTGISYEDKVFHAIAYFIFAVLVSNVLWSKQIKRAILLSVIIVTTYGIIIEVLQFVLTSYRSFDLYDALANFSGALLASILLKVRHNRKLNLN